MFINAKKQNWAFSSMHQYAKKPCQMFNKRSFKKNITGFYL